MGLNPLDNDNPHSGNSQAPKFDWPALREAIAFYEREGLCYLPAGWGRKNPSLNEWEEFETRLPTMVEKADWFHEGKPTGIGVVCGGVSRGLVILAFNDPNGAREFFGEERWQKLPRGTFITKTDRGHHIWLRSDTPILSQTIPKGDNKSWLEIRSDGNFAIAPPSLHPKGILYQAIGVDSIYKPEDLAGFIDKRLSELGLPPRKTEEPPKGKPKQPKETKRERSAEFNTLAVEKLMESCVFMQHCRDSAITLSEREWWAMIRNLEVFGEAGRQKAHELSAPYRRYTEEETEQKIKDAKSITMKNGRPATQGVCPTCGTKMFRIGRS